MFSRSAVPDNWSIDSETSLPVVSLRARKVELAKRGGSQMRPTRAGWCWFAVWCQMWWSQWWRLLTKAWMSVSIAFDVKECLIDRSCLMCRKHDRLRAAMWLAMVSSLLIRMPTSLTTVENCTVAFGNVNVCAVTLQIWYRVPSHITWVLSSLIFRWPVAIQSRNFTMQLVRHSIALDSSVACVLMQTCASSA